MSVIVLAADVIEGYMYVYLRELLSHSGKPHLNGPLSKTIQQHFGILFQMEY